MNKKKFDLMSIILLGINGVIGSGIFLLPGNAYKLFGAQSIWIYLLDTLLVLSLALCFAEVGGMFDKTGGDYIYAKEAYGEFIGFEVGIMKWAIFIIGWATMAVGFSTALGIFFPAAANGTAKNIISITILVGLGVINLFGIEIAKVLNDVITIGKLIPMILFIVIGMFFIKGSNFTQVHPVEMKNFAPTVILVFYAFTGFESLAVAAGDMENPKKNVPIAIITTILTSSIIYVLIQTVSVGNLGPALSGSATPVADSAKVFLGNFGKIIIALGTLISIGGINVATSFSTPRSGVALAEGGILPSFIASKNRFNQPYIAIIISVLIAVPLVLSGGFVQLAVMSVISKFGQYIPTSLSVIVFRRRNKLKSSFRVPFGYTLPIVAVSLSLWMIYNSWIEDLGKPLVQNRVLVGLGGFIVGVPLYFIFKYLRKEENTKKFDEVSERS
jgi:amino acid transporter